MEFLLKTLSPKLIIQFLPLLLIKAGNYFKNKDANNTGADDAFGNVLIAFAPAVAALDENNENAFKKALKVVHTTLGNYLNQN